MFDAINKCSGCGEERGTERVVIGIYWRDLCYSCGQRVADTITQLTPHAG